jgi:hypothetical protein
MEVYRRYFKITKGPVIEGIKLADETNEAARLEYQKIISDLGAEDTYYQLNSGRLVGFMFKEEPCHSLFRKSELGGWYPRKNTKEGKALHQRICSIQTMNRRNSIKAVGLADGPLFVDGNMGYAPSIVIIPSTPMQVFIGVPWIDVEPVKIEQYKSDRDAGKHNDTSLNFLICWQPTSDMEVSNEEAESAAIEDWNQSIDEDLKSKAV